MVRVPWSTVIAVWVIVCLGGGRSALAQAAPSATPSSESPDATASVQSPTERQHKYLWGTFGPPGLIAATFSSGFRQWRDAPREWGQSGTAYAKRWGSAFGESLIGDTTTYAIARWLDQDPSFAQCDCSGPLRRIRHGALSPFTARSREGTSVFSAATVAGLTVGNLVVAKTWYPAPSSARGDLKHAAVGVVGKVGVDLLREFVHRR
jgi:hypothetical protein